METANNALLSIYNQHATDGQNENENENNDGSIIEHKVNAELEINPQDNTEGNHEEPEINDNNNLVENLVQFQGEKEQKLSDEQPQFKEEEKKEEVEEQDKKEEMNEEIKQDNNNEEIQQEIKDEEMKQEIKDEEIKQDNNNEEIQQEIKDEEVKQEIKDEEVKQEIFSQEQNSEQNNKKEEEQEGEKEKHNENDVNNVNDGNQIKKAEKEENEYFSSDKQKKEIFEANDILSFKSSLKNDNNKPKKNLGLLNEFNPRATRDTLSYSNNHSPTNNLNDSLTKKLNELKTKMDENRMASPVSPRTNRYNFGYLDTSGLSNSIVRAKSPSNSNPRFNDLFSMLNKYTAPNQTQSNTSKLASSLLASTFKSKNKKAFNADNNFGSTSTRIWGNSPKNSNGFTNYSSTGFTNFSSTGFRSKNKNAYTKDKKEPESTYLDFAKSFGKTKMKTLICDTYEQKKSNPTTLRNINFSEVSKNRHKRENLFNREYYNRELSSFGSKLFGEKQPSKGDNISTLGRGILKIAGIKI